jgi:hypothetical protein
VVQPDDELVDNVLTDAAVSSEACARGAEKLEMHSTKVVPRSRKTIAPFIRLVRIAVCCM